MATKLKNFSRAWYMKFLAYVLIAVTAGGVLLYVGNRENYIGLSNLTAGSYKESLDMRSYLFEYMRAAIVAGSLNPEELDINNKEYWNFPETGVREDIEENIAEVGEEKTETIETIETPMAAEAAYNTEVYLMYPIENKKIAETVKNEIRNFYNVWWNENGYCHLTITYDGEGDLFYRSSYDVPYSQKVDLSYDNFIKEHPQMEKQVLAGVLRGMQNEYERAVDTLSYGVKDFGIVYEILESEEDSEEVRAKYEALPVYIRFERNYITNSSIQNMIGNTLNGDYYDDFALEKKVCYLGMSQEYYQEKNSQWEEDTAAASTIVSVILIGVLSVFAVFLYLSIVTGRRPEEEGVHLYPIDRIWSEVQWSIGCCMAASIVVLLIEVVFGSVELRFNYFAAIVVVIVAMGLVLLALILSQIRLAKAGKWLDSFICIRILKKCFNWLKRWVKRIIAGLKSDKIARTAYILAFVLPFICATWIGLPVVILFLCFLIYHYLEDFLTICNGVEQIRSGDIHYRIKIKNEDGLLKKLADNINEFTEGLKAAVSNELRSERLKAELISNVSHDLKTPLTSIVTYVDLLKQEEIENETAKDYIEVIDRKAQRLTVLTNDLFEAAKASSGDMPVNIETVDLNALVRQALGEFDEKLEKAELNVRLSLPEQPSYVKADGRLTWRVIDNLLNNVVKYGQTGSRVYIEVKDCGNTFGMTIKNISAYELNIPADELMERFKRGDESRNSEGSGLGLSIANSLIDLQHGSFKISIDGDLFKAEFELPKGAE